MKFVINDSIAKYVLRNPQFLSLPNAENLFRENFFPEGNKILPPSELFYSYIQAFLSRATNGALEMLLTLHEKESFLLNISSVNATKSAVS